jgi:transcriptional regulator with XRE-family HTH domain
MNRTDLAHSFAVRLRSIRLQRGISQCTLADRMDTSCSHVQALEKGKTLPEAPTLRKAAVALDVPIGDLLPCPTILLPFHSYLLLARLRAGLLQRELAEQAGVARPSLARYERGYCLPVQRATVEKLAEVLQDPVLLQRYGFAMQQRRMEAYRVQEEE